MAKELRIEIIVDAATGTATLKQFDKTLGDVEKKAGGPVNDALTKLDKTTQGLGGTMGKLGSYLAGFFTVTAILGAIRGASDFADSLVKLSDKTGIEIDALQRLKSTAENSGNSLEQVAQGVAMMSARIGKGGEETESALTRIGLSAERLKAMKPEEQFVEIARALSAVTTQADRDALGMAILGRSYLELKPTLKAAKDGLDEVAGASEASVRGFDRLGDAVMQFYEQRIKGGLVSALGGAVVFVDHLRDSVSHLAKGELHEGILALTLYDEKLLKVVDSLGLVERAQREVADRGFKPAVLSAKELAGIEDELTASAERQIEANKQLTIAQKARADAMKAMSGQAILDQANEAVAAYLAISKQGLIPTEEEQAKLNKLVTDAIAIYDRAGREVPRDLKGIEESTRAVIVGTQTWQKAARLAVATVENPQYQHLYDGLLISLDSVEQKYMDLMPAIKGNYQAAEESSGKLARMAEGFRVLGEVSSEMNSRVGQTFQALGNTMTSWQQAAGEGAEKTANQMVAAFSGAANVIAGLFGGSTGKWASTAVGAAGGAAAGAAIGVAWGGVGAGIGAAIGGVVGAVAGYTMAVKKMREANAAATAEVQRLGEQLVSTYGSLQNISTMGKIVGVDLAGAWGDQSQAGLKHFQGLMDEFQRRMSLMQTALEKYGMTWLDLGQDMRQMQLGKAAEDMAEEFTILVDAGVDVNKVLKSMAPAVNDLIVSAVRAGTKIPAVMEPIIKQMIELNLITRETADVLLGLDSGFVDWQKAEALAEKYGGTIDQLGTKFSAAKLQAQWGDIWKDWEAFVAMGADVGGMLAFMGDDIQTLVQTSMSLGTKIPEQFKPIIQQLIEMGQLFDANGAAITDITQLEFGGTLVSEIDRIVEAIDKLIETLTNGLTPALRNVPDEVNVRVKYNYEEYEPGGYTGGATAHNGAYVGYGGLARYHAGGVARGLVPRYHLGADEVPAILQAGEGVLSRHVGMPAIGGRATLRALNTGQARLGPVEIGVGGGALLAEIRALAASMQAVAARPVQAATYLDGRKVSKNQVRYIPGTLTKAGR